MPDSSALLIVCLSGCVLISMRVFACVRGFTMDAMSAGLPVFLHPSMYMKLFGFHAAWNVLMGLLLGLWLGWGTCR
jgi:hypothetical protein